MKKHNNLIWFVAATAMVLSLVVVCNDQVYGAYRRQHMDVPAPALVFQAFTETPSLQEENLPVKASAAVKLASNETYSEIGPGMPENEAKIPEQAADSTAETQPEQSEQQEQPAQSAQPEQPVQVSQPVFVTADMSYFDDACFIGDSFTQGLSIYSKNPGADYYYSVGVSTKGISKASFTLPGGGTGKLWDALGQKQYKKVYLLLGINELGGDAPEVFAQRYGEIVKQIQAVQPEATVFIQSILHTTQNKSASSAFKNEIVNRNNEALKMLADNNKVFYIDINPLFDDETGALRSDISGDGVHLKAPCYIEWRDYLLRNVPAWLVSGAGTAIAA